MVSDSSSAPRLRVVIDSRIPDGAWGGVQQVVAGLASGFAGLELSPETLFLTLARHAWLKPYLGQHATAVVAPAATGSSRRRAIYERTRKVLPSVAGIGRLAAPIASRLSIPVPSSDGFLESLGPDIVHFATQQAFLTSVPSVYQPHDLQHLHLPELFTPLQRRYREVTYRRFAEQASAILVMTEWGREDVVRSLGVDRSRIAVVPWAPVAGLGLDGSTSPAAIDLPDRFILYPGQTWPHKNHVRLIEAVAVLKARGQRIDLVAIGRQNEHFPRIQARAVDLGLADQVHFLGYLPEAMVDAVYRRATALIFPSLFEGWGLPVVEAFAYGLPVACSDATVLPEVTAGAALLFDPHDPDAIAAAIDSVVNDPALRDDLRRRGQARAAQLSWVDTAGKCAALYKKILGLQLTAGEVSLLASPTLVA